MPLIYNYGQKGISIPRVVSRIYKYASLTEVPSVEVQVKKKTIKTTINSRKRIDDAWAYLKDNCAKRAKCNDYFANLSRKMTLSDIMNNVTFTVHCLVPKEGHKDDELPLANSSGQDFALSIWAFLDTTTGAQNTTPALAATILHELAHYAGATTNRADKNSLQAENALMHCGLKQYHNPESKG